MCNDSMKGRLHRKSYLTMNSVYRTKLFERRRISEVAVEPVSIFNYIVVF